MNTFRLNGNTIVAKKFDFNLVCDLEDMGVSIQNAGTKPMAMVRAYIAICLGSTIEKAGAEMEEHLVNGGDFEEVMDVMNKEMEASDFFRALGSKQTKKTPKAQTSKK